MSTHNLDYYRQRADEELEAAEQAQNPSISQIHREMAQRYRDMLSGESDRMNSDTRMAPPAGRANAGPRHVLV